MTRRFPHGWKIGAELEIADSLRDVPLPGASTWDRKEYSIVNSNGIAADPLGKIWKYGGEINTEPSDSIGSQLDIIKSIFEVLHPKPVVTYRCGLHIHFSAPGLSEDLPRVKRAILWTNKMSPEFFERVCPLPDSATKQQRGWRHSVLRKDVLSKIEQATTGEGIRAAHARLSWQGKPQHHLVVRAGVNFIPLYEATKTVEFRCFPMSVNLGEIGAAMEASFQFLTAALDNGTLPAFQGEFPKQLSYDDELEQRYKQTCRKYVRPAAAIQLIRQWEEHAKRD